MEWGDLSDAAAPAAVAVEEEDPPVAGGASDAPDAPVASDAAGGPGRGPGPAPVRPGAAGAGNGVSAIQAALRSLATGKGLPAGIGPFLRAAQVVEADDARVLLEMPAGPGLERLATEPVTLRAVEDALAERLGHRRTIAVRGMEREQGRPEQPARLTPERVKQERLARMSREEPLLGRVVEAWELELLD